MLDSVPGLEERDEPKLRDFFASADAFGEKRGGRFSWERRTERTGISQLTVSLRTYNHECHRSYSNSPGHPKPKVNTRGPRADRSTSINYSTTVLGKKTIGLQVAHRVSRLITCIVQRFRSLDLAHGNRLRNQQALLLILLLLLLH